MDITVTKWANQDGAEAWRFAWRNLSSERFGLQNKKETPKNQPMSMRSIFDILSPFDSFYDKMSPAERSDLIKHLSAGVRFFNKTEQILKTVCEGDFV